MKAVEERIRYYTEYLKILWLVAITLSGGLASLFSNLENFKHIEKLILFILGVYLLTVVGIGILKINLDIQKLIRKLEEEDTG